MSFLAGFVVAPYFFGFIESKAGEVYFILSLNLFALGFYLYGRRFYPKATKKILDPTKKNSKSRKLEPIGHVAMVVTISLILWVLHPLLDSPRPYFVPEFFISGVIFLLSSMGLIVFWIKKPRSWLSHITRGKVGANGINPLRIFVLLLWGGGLAGLAWLVLNGL